MGKKARSVLSVLFLVALMVFWGREGLGQEKFPSRPIQVVIPYGPGGTHDIAARIVDGQLQEILKVPIIHVNKPGGGGVIGAAFAKEQKPDGYTVLYGGLTVVVELPIVTPNSPYKTEDFIPIARVTYGALVLSVKKDSPLSSLEEFIKAAKKDPGKVTLGIPGIGTSQHLVAKLFEAEAKIELNMIPFKGDGAAITAMLGGHVQAVMTGITSITPHLKSGEVNTIASSGLDRHPVFKDVPLFKEKGLPEVAIYSWTGPFVPVGTPAPVVKTLSDAYQEAATHPSIVSLLEKSGTTPGYLSSEEVKKLIPSEYSKIAKAAKAAGMIK
ncbi:MAG: tripartite tricarboxylate transporter substrate binding protein [Deltaproteobacteria bacterium]|nr:tripartite tricarboxylate transporter substrate binding protein [Deltaproteobacteria bacterium]